MRFDRNSHLQRCIACFLVGAVAAAFGLGLGALGVGEPASSFLIVTFAVIFVLSLIGILS